MPDPIQNTGGIEDSFAVFTPTSASPTHEVVETSYIGKVEITEDDFTQPTRARANASLSEVNKAFGTVSPQHTVTFHGRRGKVDTDKAHMPKFQDGVAGKNTQDKENNENVSSQNSPKVNHNPVGHEEVALTNHSNNLQATCLASKLLAETPPLDKAARETKIKNDKTEFFNLSCLSYGKTDEEFIKKLAANPFGRVALVRVDKGMNAFVKETPEKQAEMAKEIATKIDMDKLKKTIRELASPIAQDKTLMFEHFKTSVTNLKNSNLNSIEHFVQTPLGNAALLEQGKKVYNDENIEFLNVVDEFTRAPVLYKFKAIAEKYVKEGGIKEVNISAPQRDALMKKLENAADIKDLRSVFDEARGEIAKLLMRDIGGTSKTNFLTICEERIKKGP